jgi:hypothetical protein
LEFTGAPGRSGVMAERTWLQLMCCALSISRSLYVRSWGRVESRQRSGRRAELTAWSKVEDQRFEIRGLRSEVETEAEAEAEAKRYRKGIKSGH